MNLYIVIVPSVFWDFGGKDNENQFYRNDSRENKRERNYKRKTIVFLIYFSDKIRSKRI